MNSGFIMYSGLFLLNIYVVAGASAFHTLLVANNDGVHIVDPISKDNKTILPFEKGANSVGYNLKTGYVYGILKSNQPKQFRIVRTKVLETTETHSCSQKDLVDWCRRNKYCLKICKSSNPYNPEKVLEPQECFKANNLVLDWVNNHIYWTCDPNSPQTSTLNMATMEGSDSKYILSRPKQIQSLDIDVFEGKLFILESNNMFSTDLQGGNEVNIFQFNTRNEEITKISLDTQLKVLYVVGYELRSSDERFLASLTYDGFDYKKLYTSKDPAWQFGPQIVNSIVYWLALSNGTEWHRHPVGDSVTKENIKMDQISVPYSVNQWSIVHLDAQRPEGGSYCSRHGCSHDCSHSQWMRITCQCPPGMALGADNRTCHENQIAGSKNTTETSSGGQIRDKTTHVNAELYSSNSSENSGPTKNISDNGKNSGEPKVARPKSENTTKETFVEPAVNGSSVESAVEASQNATEAAEAAGVVTASSSSMTLLRVMVTTVIISIFIVVVVFRKRAKMGNYQPKDSRERTDFSPF